MQHGDARRQWWLAPALLAAISSLALGYVSGPESSLLVSTVAMLLSSAWAASAAARAMRREFLASSVVLSASMALAPLVVLSERPLLVQPYLALSGLCLVVVSSVLWQPDGRRSLLVLAHPVGVGAALTSTFPTSASLLGIILWAALPAVLFAASLAHVSLLRRAVVPQLTLRPSLASSYVLCASLLAAAGLTREAGRLRLESVDFLYPSALPSLLLASILPAGGLLAAALFALSGRFERPRLSHAALAAVVVASLGPAVSADLPLEPPPNTLMGRIDDARALDLALTRGELYLPGAGPRFEYRGASFEECDLSNSRDCFITHYDDIALRYGVAAAVEDIVSKVHGNVGFTFPAHCHQVVHNLGQMAYDLAREFSHAAIIDPQVCGTGFTHGLWEKQMFRLGPDAWFGQTATLCEQLNMSTPWYKWTCSHILGHLISTAMMDNPAVAVEYCNAITDPQAILDCYTGAWMNFFQDDSVIAWFRSFGSIKELFEICYGAAQSVKLFCYQELFPVIYPLVNGSDFLAAESCLRFAEPARSQGDPWSFSSDNYTDRCLQGLARAVAVSSSFSPDFIADRCLSMPDEAHSACLTSTAASVVLNTGSTAAAFPLCQAVPDPDYREYCYFWTKHSRRLLANGPNSQNMPEPGELRLPQGRFEAPGGASRPFSVPAA